MNPVNLLFQFADSFAFVVLSAIGLTVIFGMMGIINLAHGEFIMLGAYGTTLSYNAGFPLVAAMGVGVATSAVFGLILERTVVKRLYDRLFDSMVATWAVGLILTQGVRIAFGNSLGQIGTPLGSVTYGGFSYSAYRVLLAGVALVVLLASYLVFTRTEFGVRARATIQDADTARAMGVDTDRMYASTFVIGSGLAGLTGALYAPTITMVPSMGSSFLVEAFVAVVTGGGTVLLGTTLAGAVLGAINATFTNLYGTFYGQIAMLVTAIVVIRWLPGGLTSLVDRTRDSLARGDG